MSLPDNRIQPPPPGQRFVSGTRSRPATRALARPCPSPQLMQGRSNAIASTQGPMLKTALSAALLLALLTPGVAAQAPTVRSAYLLEDSLVAFDPPTELPWDSLLPPGLRPAALEIDSAGLRRLYGRRDDFGNTELTFPLPVPPSLAQLHYYLLDSTGVHEVHPGGLRGTVRIEWAPKRPTIARVGTFGVLTAEAPAGSHGGFLLVAPTALDLRVAPSHWSADTLLAPHGGTYPGQHTPFRQIVREYQIQTTAPGLARLVWVQWAPDTAMFEAGCSLRYALFRWEADPEVLGTTDDGCDV